MRLCKGQETRVAYIGSECDWSGSPSRPITCLVTRSNDLRIPACVSLRQQGYALLTRRALSYSI